MTAWPATYRRSRAAPPRQVALIDPLDTGHHCSYARYLASGLLNAGTAVHVIGTAAMIAHVQAAVPQATGEVLALYPGSAAAYYALPRSERERLNRRFHRRAAHLARQQGCDVAHYLYLDSYLLPLLAVLLTGAGRGLRLHATLHWAYFMREFRPGHGRAALFSEWAHLRMLQVLGSLGVRVQLHSRAQAGDLQRRTGQPIFDYAPYPVEPPLLAPEDRPGVRASVRAQFGIPPAAPVLLAFGGTRHDKGSDLAIQALALLPDHHLLIVGPTRSFDAERFRALAAEQKVCGRLHLRLEHVPDADVEGYFVAADLVLLPYRRSFAGQSGPLLIGGALGVPVLASAVSVLTETIAAYGLGAQFPPEDPVAMATAIRQYDLHSYRPETARFRQDHLPATFVSAVIRSYCLPTAASEARPAVHG
jgi:glycosyltransferase involved in cell wall biosynthesis